MSNHSSRAKLPKREDSRWIEATLRGETAAFGTLVEKYQDRLYNSMFHVLGSAEDARDIVQDTFVQAFVKLESFRGSSAFYTWLYRIGFNLAMSHGRRHRPTKSLDWAKASFSGEPAGHEPGPEARLMQREKIEMVHVALSALSDEYRQVLVLRELEGYRYEKIAEILALPLGTVRSRLYRARMQLHEQLTARFEEEFLPGE